jgi:hypothetical protein
MGDVCFGKQAGDTMLPQSEVKPRGVDATSHPEGCKCVQKVASLGQVSRLGQGVTCLGRGRTGFIHDGRKECRSRLCYVMATRGGTPADTRQRRATERGCYVMLCGVPHDGCGVPHDGLLAERSEV